VSDGIQISWSTVGETFGARLDLHRIDSSSGAADTTLLAADMQPKPGPGSVFHNYEYVDSDVMPGQRFRYFVAGYFELDYGDTTIQYNPKSDTYEAQGMFDIPSESLSSYLSPNPFSEMTHISVRVPTTYVRSAGNSGSSTYGVSSLQQTDVDITIYDVAGRPVSKIFNGRLYGGVATFNWNGTNSRGQRVTSGVYFVKTIAGSVSEVKKVVIVR